MKLKVFIHTDADGGFWAKVPALPGCVAVMLQTPTASGVTRLPAMLQMDGVVEVKITASPEDAVAPKVNAGVPTTTPNVIV